MTMRKLTLVLTLIVSGLVCQLAAAANYTVTASNTTGSANDILDAVFQELGTFTQGTRTEDDITLVIVKITRS